LAGFALATVGSWPVFFFCQNVSLGDLHSSVASGNQSDAIQKPDEATINNNFEWGPVDVPEPAKTAVIQNLFERAGFEIEQVHRAGSGRT